MRTPTRRSTGSAKTILARIAGRTEEEAYLYVTTVGNLRNGAVWPMGRHEMPLVVGVEVPLNEPVGGQVEDSPTGLSRGRER